MKELKLSLLVSLMFAMLFSITLAAPNSLAMEHEQDHAHEKDIVQGNIVCLIPDRDKGTVKPVIASEQCHGMQPHAHVIVGTKGEHKGFVYGIEGSPEAIEKLEKMEDRTDVKIEGNVSGTERGWILKMD